MATLAPAHVCVLWRQLTCVRTRTDAVVAPRSGTKYVLYPNVVHKAVERI